MRTLLYFILFFFLGLELVKAQKKDKVPAYHITIEERAFGLRYYQYGNRIGEDEVKIILTSSPEAGEIFRRARLKKIASGAALGIATYIVANSFRSDDLRETFIVDAGLSVFSLSASYLLRRKYKEQIEEAIESHNAHIARKIYK